MKFVPPLPSRILAALALLAGLGAAACGDLDRGAAVPDDGESAEYARTLAEYGGAYADPALAAWVNVIGRSLVAHSGRPDMGFNFTVLDSGAVNAFATPGGHVYVTRGLLALAQDEAEVAAALGHEIGHLVAGDRAEGDAAAGAASVPIGRLSAARLFAPLLAPRTPDQRARFSQEQEYHADAFGVEAVAAAGYDPHAAASFLANIERDARLRALRADTAGAAPPFGYGDSHPLTSDRAARAEEAAGARRGKTSRDAYLRAIDGMVYGDGPGQGYVRGRLFVHPTAGFAFAVPEGFAVESSRSTVIASRGDGAALVLTSAPPKTAATPLDYLIRDWARGVRVTGADSVAIDGRPAAVAAARTDSDYGPVDIRLAVIGWSPSLVYRLAFITPVAATAALAPAVAATIGGFRALRPGEAAGLPPDRLRIVTVKPGETVAALAARLPFATLKEDRFRALNGLGPDDRLRAGERVKLVE